MLNTALGILILVVEFILLNTFFSKKDKKYPLVYSFFTLVVLNFFIALFTMSLSIFSYTFVLILHLLFVVLMIFIYKKQAFDLKLFKKVDLMIIAVVVISLFALYHVHFSYNGIVTTINEPLKNVSHASMQYPYYSDEWAAVSVINYALESGKLPLVNPLLHNQFFPNLEFGFHSFLAELFIFFDVNVLNGYSYFVLLFGVLICLMVYYLCRALELEKISSAVAALSVLFIIESSNLPGIWYLMPITLGALALLFTFFFIALDDKKYALFSSFITLLLYPPLIVFILPAFAVYLFFKVERKRFVKYISLFLGISAIAAVILSIKVVMSDFSFSFILTRIFYVSLTPTGIPDYAIWKVLPFWILALAVLGIITNYNRKKWLSSSLIVGLLYWIIYSQTIHRFIIDYQRDVFISSILIVVFAGFGANEIIKYLQNRLEIKNLKWLKVAIIITFLFFAFSYTSSSRWESMTLNLFNGDRVLPTGPATEYLLQEDLNLFSNISGKNFLSTGWKGLVIGVATNNYPLETKASTISVNLLSYQKFMESNCSQKDELAIRYYIDYVYSNQFLCSSFEEIGRNSEGFVLYRFKK